MIINPILPIWLMIIVVIIMFVLSIKNKKKIIYTTVMIIIIFIINLRPMVRKDNFKITATNLDVLFVIDNTISMIAEDYQGDTPRLNAVKEDCKYIAEELYGSRFALITFDNMARLDVPFTRDINTFKEGIEIMSPIDYLYGRGSTLSIPVSKMNDFLERSTKKEKTKTILFYISDGEINTGQPKVGNEFVSLSKYLDGGAVLGYGSKEGGPMKKKSRYDEEDQVEYITNNSSSEKELSKIDEENLKSISQQLKMKYVNMSDRNNINSVLKEVKNTLVNVDSEENLYSYDDIYYLFVIPLLGISIYFYIKNTKELL